MIDKEYLAQQLHVILSSSIKYLRQEYCDPEFWWCFDILNWFEEISKGEGGRQKTYLIKQGRSTKVTALSGLNDMENSDLVTAECSSSKHEIRIEDQRVADET